MSEPKEPEPTEEREASDPDEAEAAQRRAGANATAGATASAGDGEEEEGEEEEEERPAKGAPRPATGPSMTPEDKRVLRLCVVGLLAMFVVAFVVMGLVPDRIRFAEDVDLLDAEVTRQVGHEGGNVSLTLRMHVQHPLAVDHMVFAHVEAVKGGIDAVRFNRDERPPVPSTRWHDQELVHKVEIPFDKGLPAGRYEIFVGLFDPHGGKRLPLVDPRRHGDRVLAGWVDVIPGDDPDTAARTITPREMRIEESVGPWLLWLGGLAIAAALAVFGFLRRKVDQVNRDAPMEDNKDAPWMRALAFFPPAVSFVAGIFLVLEFIKDDAYISWRYAHNLVTGNGLVFNRGEHLEGFTNFLWVFVIAPFEALGWDIFQVCQVLGTILGIVCLALVGAMTFWMDGERKALSHLWGSFWLATSSSFVLWAQAGLEQPLASLLPMAGAYVLWRYREEGKVKHLLGAGLIMGAACMTRPELHLMAILVGLPLVVDTVRMRKIPRVYWLYVAGILLVTVPCHTFRYLYYGSLVPNTFYVKTGGGAGEVFESGMRSLRDMFLFNDTWVLVVLAPLAFASRARLAEKATMAVISAAFMAYLVSVGLDEMTWHRLYLPALPFLCVLAALGARNAVDVLVATFARKETLARAHLVAYAVGWVGLFLLVRNNLAFTSREYSGYNGHGDYAGTFHPDLGKFIVRHERPHGLVAFQDMGSTPYHAPDIDFLDFIGLTDKTVARARHDYGIHTFIGTTADVQAKYDKDMREYFFQRSPEWVIFTLYTPRGDEDRMAAVFDRDPTGASFGEDYRQNNVQFNLWGDPRFHAQYVPVRTWQRSVAYYLALWRRKDLWDQTPREVVLDAPPANLSGAKAELEGGLTLLGSEMTPRATEHGEAFVTTWWQLPGPMPKDLYFYVHLVGNGMQLPADHVPGDWMYPASRWQKGEILEDRILVQLPPFVVYPGTYDVYVGAYRRVSGQRLKVVGEDGESQGVKIGTLEVTSLRPLIDQLIPPTRVDVMRKYPDRIVDAHRN